MAYRATIWNRTSPTITPLNGYLISQVLPVSCENKLYYVAVMHAGGRNKVRLGQQREFKTHSLPSNQRSTSTPGMSHQP
ncbi:hypothetical protein AB4239_03465 [Vibrio sp. 10N.286.45.C10]|uniref:hypothetical protein n=1 Tax=unclassified Vibrio TaxID=2614977 RepID=UPI003551CB07